MRRRFFFYVGTAVLGCPPSTASRLVTAEGVECEVSEPLRIRGLAHQNRKPQIRHAVSPRRSTAAGARTSAGPPGKNETAEADPRLRLDGSGPPHSPWRARAPAGAYREQTQP